MCVCVRERGGGSEENNNLHGRHKLSVLARLGGMKGGGQLFSLGEKCPSY